MNDVNNRYFDALYARSRDPWRVADSWYEIRKRRLLLAALPRPRFSYAYEPGCGTGELTVELAKRCDRLLAGDFSENALLIARQKTAGATHVELRRQTMPHDWPAANASDSHKESGSDGYTGAGNIGIDAVTEPGFDLIVISEFAYYLDDGALQTLVSRAAAALAADGCLIACHWRHDFAERTHTTDAVHASFDHQTGLCRAGGYRDADFLLDIWTAQQPSVAQRVGLR